MRFDYRDNEKVDFYRCSFFTQSEAIDWWIEWLGINHSRTIKSNATLMCTAGGRKYLYGPNFNNVMHNMMGFILSEAGIKLDRDSQGHYRFEKGKVDFVLYHPGFTTTNETFTDKWFFDSCLWTYGDNFDLIRLYNQHRYRALIVQPCDLYDSFETISKLASQGVVVLTTAQALKPDLNQRWLQENRTIIFDYCIAWDSGLVFYTCQHGQKHVLPIFGIHNDRHELSTEPNIELSSFSNVLNFAQPFIDQVSGDTIILHDGLCDCLRGWRCSMLSRRDEHLIYRSKELIPVREGIDPPWGTQIFQDHNQEVTIRYDDPNVLVDQKDAIDATIESLNPYFGPCNVLPNRIKRGNKIPGIYSLAIRKQIFGSL